MAITLIEVELRGRVNDHVTALSINGTPVALDGLNYAATITLPATSTSVTLVATYADGSQHTRRLLVGEHDLPAAGGAT